VACPAPSGVYILTDSSGVAGDHSFGLHPSDYIKDVRVSMVTSRARPGSPLIYSITCQNVGTITADGTIRLVLDPSLTFNHSTPSATRELPPLLEWNFTNLRPGNDFLITVVTTVPQTTELGTMICSDVGIVPNNQFVNSDNRDSVCVEVTGSYDPNDITVVPYGLENNGVITPEDSVLTYTIRFQNTGNDTAFKVVVVDTLSSHLDIRSIRLGAASHPFSFSIDGANILTWTFDDILLPDSNANEMNSHGMFKYSVHLKPGLGWGTTISNRASIYFDHNKPVMTNIISSIITDAPAAVEPTVEEGIALFPNPVRGSLRIAGEMDAGSVVAVQDVLGRTVLEQPYSGGDMVLDMGALPAGTYFVKIPARSGAVLRQVNVVR
jgi:uncharacterized repeat protein (TIGR01451 family)